MQRFFRLNLILCITFAVFTGTAILIGRQQPQSERLAVLHLSDCAPPCWLDIVPGVTRLDDAIPRIKARYANILDYNTSFNEYPTAFTVQVINRENADDSFAMSVYSYQDRRVSAIVFGVHLSQSSPNIAELSNVLGMPARMAITVTRAVTSYTVAFSDHACVAATTLPDVHNHTGILQRPNSLTFCDGQNMESVWRSWRGFQTIDAYLR